MQKDVIDLKAIKKKAVTSEDGCFYTGGQNGGSIYSARLHHRGSENVTHDASHPLCCCC